MNSKRLLLSATDIEAELKQCEEEGRDLSELNSEFKNLLALELFLPENQIRAESFLDETILAPIIKNYAFVEPSDLAGIRADRPTSVKIPVPLLSEAVLLDKIHGGMTGKSVGRLLGLPVSGWLKKKLHGYLNDSGLFPLNGFFNGDSVSESVREKFELVPGWGRSYCEVDLKPGDEADACVRSLGILKRFGKNFTPSEVASSLLADHPPFDAGSSEEAALRNLETGITASHSASFRNPYRERNGTPTKADFWGYVAPGAPEIAAEFAWRSASVSHVKNGIYGEMRLAAMISAAFGSDDIREILLAGLSQIPEKSRLADSIDSILEWHEIEIDYDNAVYRIHELWKESQEHSRRHTIPNAMIVAAALLWGEGDYAKSICLAVQAGFDTTNNGGAVGAILGVILGRKALPSNWTDRVQEKPNADVAGHGDERLEALARETLSWV